MCCTGMAHCYEQHTHYWVTSSAIWGLGHQAIRCSGMAHCYEQHTHYWVTSSAIWGLRHQATPGHQTHQLASASLCLHFVFCYRCMSAPPSHSRSGEQTCFCMFLSPTWSCHPWYHSVHFITHQSFAFY